MAEFFGKFGSSVSYVWNQFIAVMSSFRVIDAIDILVVAFLIYKIVQLVRQTRAKQIIFGVFAVMGLWFISYVFKMTTLNFLLSSVLGQGVIALAIIFQPEIRSMLEHVSHTNFSLTERTKTESERVEDCINNVCASCAAFQQTKTGALIVFERQTKLGDIIQTGTEINSDAKSELIENIFYPKTPLHDGAMIIRNGRICAAGCILPLTKNNNLKRQLGTRHRASIGITEVSDAIVVVVSEETGIISLSSGGEIVRDYNSVTLKEALRDALLDFGQKSILPRNVFKKRGGGKKND